MWILGGIICFKYKGEAFCLHQISSVELFLFKMTEFGYEQYFLRFNTVSLFLTYLFLFHLMVADLTQVPFLFLLKKKKTVKINKNVNI